MPGLQIRASILSFFPEALGITSHVHIKLSAELSSQLCTMGYRVPFFCVKISLMGMYYVVQLMECDTVLRTRDLRIQEAGTGGWGGSRLSSAT